MKKNKNPDFSVISRGEIITGMRQAKDPKAQKEIYAELCCCDPDCIDEILTEEKMKTTWTDEQIEELKNLVESGHTNAYIAKHFSKTPNQITMKIYDLRKKGILPPAKKLEYSAYVPEKDIKPAPLEKGVDDEELKYWQERCAVAEAALERKIKELFYERESTTQLRILAKMIARATEEI